MRKLLLATTALAGVAMFASGAQAMTDESPLNVTIGGYVDFRAGHFSEEENDNTPATLLTYRRNMDFETEWKVNVDVVGQAMQGLEYGGRISIWNGSQYTDGGHGGKGDVRQDQAYVYLSGQYGKLTAGDHHGASDLFVYAPTVGQGQVDGSYTDFTDPTTLAVFMPSYFNNEEDSTKVSYMTPQVGNENHKVQLGVSYTPNQNDEGQNIIKYERQSTVTSMIGTAGAGIASFDTVNGTDAAPYEHVLEFGGQYQGTFNPVNVVLSFEVVTGDDENTWRIPTTGSPVSGMALRDFTLWGVGGQVSYAGFTVGGSYVDAGDYMTVAGQDRDQSAWSAGITYSWDKLAVAFNYLGAEGYANGFAVQGAAASGIGAVNYVDSFDAFGFGGVYTWFPGFSTNLDVVLFNQERADLIAAGNGVDDNDGHVVMVTQKLTW